MDKIFWIVIYAIGGLMLGLVLLGVLISSIQDMSRTGGISRVWSNFIYGTKKIVLPIIMFLTACLLLVAAIASLPDVFYQFLRWIVCIVSLLAAWYFYKSHRMVLGWFFVVPAIIFNPIAPFYFDKNTWIPIDCIFAMFFMFVSIYDADEIIG